MCPWPLPVSVCWPLDRPSSHRLPHAALSFCCGPPASGLRANWVDRRPYYHSNVRILQMVRRHALHYYASRLYSLYKLLQLGFSLSPCVPLLWARMRQSPEVAGRGDKLTAIDLSLDKYRVVVAALIVRDLAQVRKVVPACVPRQKKRDIRRAQL